MPTFGFSPRMQIMSEARTRFHLNQAVSGSHEPVPGADDRMYRFGAMYFDVNPDVGLRVHTPRVARMLFRDVSLSARYRTVVRYSTAGLFCCDRQ